jgi:Pectate lyase superfamily protein
MNAMTQVHSRAGRYIAKRLTFILLVLVCCLAKAQLPAAFKTVYGCTNPNTGTSGRDWGTAAAPVYLDPGTLKIGNGPAYTSNTIFWVSRETSPGQSVLLSGAFTASPKTVKIALIPKGSIKWQPTVDASTVAVMATSLASTGLSFIIPTTMKSGVYGFAILDPSAPTVYGIANLPEINWMMGVSTVNPARALQDWVINCGAVPGGTLKVYGKNFSAAGYVNLRSATGSVTSIYPTKRDANSLNAYIPGNLAPGQYSLWIGRKPWDVSSSAAVMLTIRPSAKFLADKRTCSTLVGDAHTDNTALLQACLDADVEPASTPQKIAYISIPTGQYVLTGSIAPHSYQVLVGQGRKQSVFLGQPASPVSTWIAAPQYFGMTGIGLKAPANPTLLSTMAGSLYLNRVDIESTTDLSNGNEQMLRLQGPNLQVYNSYLLSNSNLLISGHILDGAVISGNRLVTNQTAWIGINDTQNLDFESNTIYSQGTPVFTGPQSGRGLSLGRGNAAYGLSALSRNLYVGYNSFQNMGDPTAQQIVVDGDGGAYVGHIASSTPTSTVLANMPNWTWMGTSNPEASAISIISGTGIGQYSFIQSYSGQTINLETPWRVLPDATSVIAITQYELNLTYAHNSITNTLGATLVLADSLEGVIEDNIIVNCQGPILISGFGPYGGPAAYGPIINTDVLRNTESVGIGTYLKPTTPYVNGGIAVQDFPGILVSGLLIRGNIVPAEVSIYSTNGQNLVNATLIEQNRATWTPYFPLPTELIQNNFTPTTE